MWDKPSVLNWIANLLFAVSVVSMLYGILFAVVHLPVFPIREVKVGGELTHVTKDQVKLIVDTHINGNFFTMDLIQARDAFEKLPWARKVSVRRSWPDALTVEIEEHKALARWGDIALVNSYGELFHAASDAVLPVFYGPGEAVKTVAKKYAEYSRILNPVDIKIAQVTLSPRRAWGIRTDEGMSIELGRVKMSERLTRFSTAYGSVLRHLKADIKYADLRYSNGFAVRKPKKLSMKLLPKVLETANKLARKGSGNEQSA